MDHPAASTTPTPTTASTHTSATTTTTPPPINTRIAASEPNGMASAGRPMSADMGLTSPDRRPKKSSSTCTTCRARKVRCNGARDVCSNCQRLGFPCSYDDADAHAWTAALPRRRVKQACMSCHVRKARCSGHLPACERCRAQGLDCVYRPTKRARISSRNGSGGRSSPQSHDGDHGYDEMHDSDPGMTEHSAATPINYHQDIPCPDTSFEALVGRTFDKFFRHVHHIPMYSFLHRASLMEQYNAGNVDKALLLALVGITSYLTDMGPGMRDYGDQCIDDAEGLIFSDYTRPSTIKVQALVFMIKHRILANKFPSAFVLLSIASRFAFALRLNHNAPNLCFLAQESRRRLIWSLYCIDAGISGGYPNFSLFRADAIHVGLPCNERNFEFDLPQPTEQLIPDHKNQSPAHSEDPGSLALHIRIQHIRHKIAEFTKGILLGRKVNPRDLQTGVLALHQELDDFATHLPTSFQFSENSLRLRAYSPRICVFVMIHVWWRQCHCDLYRIGLTGLREALPRPALDAFDDSFLEHCQRQCVDHSMAMSSIFSAMHKLNARPVADLDLALCAYQCARVLVYSHHLHADKFGLTADKVLAHANVCMQTIRECCTGAAASAIRSDLEKLVSQGMNLRGSAASSGAARGRKGQQQQHQHQQQNHRSHHSHHSRDSLTGAEARATAASANPIGYQSLPPSVIADPWPSDSQYSPDLTVTQPENSNAATSRNRAGNGTPASESSHNNISNGNGNGNSSSGNNNNDRNNNATGGVAQDMGSSELNNAYEGAFEGLGLDHGLDYAMGVDLNTWNPSADWMNPEYTNNGVGV